MRVELTDEQELLQDAVAGVVTRDAPFAAVREWTEARDLAAADGLAVRQGWTGIGLDEDTGGQGGGVQELAVLAEQLGRGAVPWDRTLAGCLAAPLLATAGTDAARELAAAIAAGTRSAVLAVDGDRPLAAVRPLDAPRGSRGDAPHHLADAGGLVTRRLRYVVGATGADELVVPVEAGEAVELYGVSAADATIRPRPIVDATRALADVTLVGAPARPLGTIPHAALDAAAQTAAVLIAADSLGAAGRLLDLTTQYVAERHQFGVPVGSFQAVKHAAAEMLVDVEGSRSAVHHGAWAVGAGDEQAAIHASVAKVQACAAAVRVADKALFLHGAVGYTWEHDLQLPFKRAKSDVLLFGSPDMHRDLVARELGLLPADAL